MDTANTINVQALRYLKRARPALTLQQFRTIKGQILAGDADGAMRGLKKLLTKKPEGKHHAKTQNNPKTRKPEQHLPCG